MPYGLKEKIHLMNGSLVRLPLCRTRRHQINRLLLHFHATSVMMPREPPAVAPPPVLRQNWKTLAQLASRRSKPPDVDAYPHTVFIRSSILRHKPTNLLPLILRSKLRNRRGDFEAEITKLSTLVLRPKLRNCCNCFEAKPLTNHRYWF
jgi:hypothetical protein